MGPNWARLGWPNVTAASGHVQADPYPPTYRLDMRVSDSPNV